ncbi:lipopolysaccharide assembly protein LapA domain-containing protein [soil metagenome]
MRLRRFLNWVLGLPIAIIVIAFCVANRRWIDISFDPFSQDAPFASMTLPVWALLFVGLLFGVILGWTACWFAQGKWRRAMRNSRTETQKVHDEVAQFRRELQARQSLTPPPS